jgi:hypothetical protein
MISRHPPNTTTSQRAVAGSPNAQIGIAKEPQSTSSRPEFFRLPLRGGDPYFGLTRSFYYEGEQRGYWRLVRIRERGKLRGVTLIPFDQVAAFVRTQMERVAK